MPPGSTTLCCGSGSRRAVPYRTLWARRERTRSLSPQRRAVISSLCTDLRSPITRARCLTWPATTRGTRRRCAHGTTPGPFGPGCCGTFCAAGSPRPGPGRCATPRRPHRGRVDLENLTSTVSIELTDCLLGEGLDARHATLFVLGLDSCRLEHPSERPWTSSGSTLTASGRQVPIRLVARRNLAVEGRLAPGSGCDDAGEVGTFEDFFVWAAQRVIDGFAGGLGFGDLVVELGELAPSELLPVVERDGA